MTSSDSRAPAWLGTFCTCCAVGGAAHSGCVAHVMLLAALSWGTVSPGWIGPLAVLGWVLPVTLTGVGVGLAHRWSPPTRDSWSRLYRTAIAGAAAGIMMGGGALANHHQALKEYAYFTRLPVTVQEQLRVLAHQTPDPDSHKPYPSPLDYIRDAGLCRP